MMLQTRKRFKLGALVVFGLCILQVLRLDHPVRALMCLPSYTFMQPEQPEQKQAKAAIVYLADFQTADRITMLEESLVALQTYFLGKFPYPVILYHEKSHCTLPSQSSTTELFDNQSSTTELWKIQKACADFKLRAPPIHNLLFEEISGFDEIPSYLDGAQVFNVTKFSLGYRFMCRFWAHGVFQQSAMKQLDYYWRMDTDLFLKKTIAFDPFVYMDNNGISYLYGATSHESESVIVGLWDTVLEYTHLHNYSNTSLGRYTDAKGNYNLRMFYNNFEVSRIDIWRSARYAQFFEYLDRTGGLLLRRWGDAPIRTLSLAALFPELKIQQWPGLCYDHTGMQWTSFTEFW